MPQQREAHPQSTARVEELKTSETQLKELSYTEEQQPLISSYLAATVEQEMSWLTPEECVWTLENPPGHPPTLEWRIKTMGGKLIPEEELDDEDADDTVSACVCLTFTHSIEVFRSTILAWEAVGATNLYRPRL